MYIEQLIDTPSEERFDRIIRVVQRLLHVPMVFIALLDDERIFLKAAIGLDEREIPLRTSFCQHVIETAFFVEIPEISPDSPYANYQWVKSEPYAEFFAGVPLLDSNSQPVGVLGILDYSPRRLNLHERESLNDLAEWVLRELNIQSEEMEELTSHNDTHVRAIIDNVRDGILTINSEGLIESFNPAAEHLFGYKASEIFGHHFMILLADPETPISPNAHVTSRISKNLGSGGEVLGKRKNGTFFPMEISVSDMWIEKKRMFTLIIRDITQRKKIEQMKSEFVSIVSHELRTPLTSIHGSLGLISSGIMGELPPKAARMTQIAYKNSERLLRLINDILDIDKIESGKMPFNMQPLELSSFLREAIEANDGYAKEFGITYRIVEDAPHALVYADKDRLIQVLTNLLSNAAKFSNKGSFVDLSIKPSGTFWKVEVRDYGMGIPEKYRPHVFGKFVQAVHAEHQARKGTGLGLNICKTIIERMNGHIGFRTKTGVGTTFFFELPAYRVADSY